MPAFIVTFIVGIVCIVLGISNMRGNISSLHSYHRKRVTEENVKPFGRLVGIGNIIIAVGMALAGGCMLLTERAEWWGIVASAVTIVGLIIGLCISFYAMIKYNGGIF